METFGEVIRYALLITITVSAWLLIVLVLLGAARQVVACVRSISRRRLHRLCQFGIGGLMRFTAAVAVACAWVRFFPHAMPLFPLLVLLFLLGLTLLGMAVHDAVGKTPPVVRAHDARRNAAGPPDRFPSGQ